MEDQERLERLYSLLDALERVEQDRYQDKDLRLILDELGRSDSDLINAFLDSCASLEMEPVA